MALPSRRPWVSTIVQRVCSVQIYISYPKSNSICYILLTINSWDMGVYHNIAIIVKFWKIQSKRVSKNAKILVVYLFSKFHSKFNFQNFSLPQSPKHGSFFIVSFNSLWIINRVACAFLGNLENYIFPLAHNIIHLSHRTTEHTSWSRMYASYGNIV